MARNIKEIYDQMAAEKASLSSLNGLLPTENIGAYVNLLAQLSSNSKVAVWRLFMYIVAVGHYIHETMWDYVKQEMELLAQKSIAGNLAWYRAEVFKWQFGHLLLWNAVNFRYYYADTTSQVAIESRLCKRVACIELINLDFKGVKIKVAKESGSTLAPLTQNELDSLQAYIDRIKFAGVETDVISQPADSLLTNVKVFYQGTLDSVAFQTAVKDKIKEYISNLDFNGKFFSSKMVDTLQSMSGVVDVVIVNNQAKSYLGSYIGFIKDYEPESGWMQLDNNSVVEVIRA